MFEVSHLTRRPVLASAFLLCGLFAACDDSGSSHNNHEIVAAGSGAVHQVAGQQMLAHVGDQVIRRSDILYRQRVEQVYADREITDSQALVGLIQEVLQYVIARRAGVAPTAEDIRAFAANVTKRSRAPELLAKVKAVFGADHASYARLYLRPVLTNIRLHQWFSRDAHVHARQRQAMEQAYALIRQGESFEVVAEKLQMHYQRPEYRNEHHDAPVALRKYMPAGVSSMTESFRQVLDGLEDGAVAATILEDDYGFRIVRLLSHRDKAYSTEEISLVKRSFDVWYASQVQDIEVSVDDPFLRQSILQSFNQLAWVGQLE